VQTGVNLRRLAGSRRDRRVRGTGGGAEFPRARYREVRVLAGGNDYGAAENLSTTDVVRFTPDFLAPDDFLLIQTLAGDDTVDSSGLPPGLVQHIVQ
jgi:hypothetical protein